MAGSFSLDLTRFIERANGNMDKALREAIRLVANGVVMETPVDSGRLRTNWQFGKFQMPVGVIDSTDKSGTATIAAIMAQAKGVRAGGEVWIGNNLPYAGRIEYGYSQKNPRGMVRVTLANLPAAIDAIFRDPP